MRTIVYVDGFNLYYGALKGTPYRSKTVGVINPQKVDCKVLRCAASFYKRIRTSDLAASQLPTTLTDATGTFHKPASW
ncbi:MAG: hypothetical protein IKR48_08525 [Kiritimatiellae bacterium]|nr:hypothetical protein [Kiritimatiellia bacterium]